MKATKFFLEPREKLQFAVKKPLQKRRGMKNEIPMQFVKT